MRATVLVRILAVALVGLLAGCVNQPVEKSGPAPDQTLPERLVGEVTGDGAYRHLQELQRIADANAGTRALGTPGYDASVEYVADQLRQAGYQVETTSFTARRFTAQQVRLGVGGVVMPATVLGYSPSTPPGGISAPLGVIAQDDTSGCEPADFAGTPAGAVVLVQRGACPFGQKVSNAATAGARAVLVTNNVDGPLDGATLGETTTGLVPALGLTKADGEALAGRAGVPVDLVANTTVEETTSRNVVAQTQTGNPAEVVMAGGHLDSVPEGPGINDNGSGSAVLLETAIRLGGSPPVANAVRFAFWGAEEEGLVGSTAYVAGLAEPDRTKIALYLNFDMLASPNSGYLVYDGDNSDAEGAGPGPAGSTALERMLVEGLAKAGATAEGTDFDGRSDYKAFIDAGIPAGGIFSGAEDSKTPEQAQRWGGTPGAPYDPCYHKACDRIDKIDRTALDRNTDAIASTIARLALTTQSLAS